MTCKITGIYQSDYCKRHNYPTLTIKRGNKFPACPPKVHAGEGTGHMVDWGIGEGAGIKGESKNGQ